MEQKSNLNNTGERKTKPRHLNSPQPQMGKLPPQAPDLEEAVLGALMLEKNALNEVIDILKPPHFYKDAHQKIFACIHELFEDSEPVDILTVTAALRKKGELDLIGGAYYISYLTNRVASSANIQYHARIISEKFILRELIRLSSETITQAYAENVDVFDLLAKSESDLFTVSQGNIRKDTDNMKDVLKQAMENIEAARKQGDGLSGVGTGFTALDQITAGWQPSDMIVLAARPGMGKTAFVLSMARNIATGAAGSPKAVAFFSLEMSSVQLVSRLISAETGISGEKLRKGNLEPHEYTQLHERIGPLTNAQIFIDDTPSLSVFELRAKARRLKQQHDIQIIIIDYLQLMTAGSDNRAGGNREQEISTISRSIKTIAKELNVPIIALSQLSRAVETRGGDKKPILSDLRESGAIEQDADIVSFIYRPEYYKITEDEEGNPTDGTGQIIIAKHRNGALDTVTLKYVSHLAKFENLDESAPYGSGEVIMQSKMNSNDNFLNDTEAPF